MFIKCFCYTFLSVVLMGITPSLEHNEKNILNAREFATFADYTMPKSVCLKRWCLLRFEAAGII